MPSKALGYQVENGEEVNIDTAPECLESSCLGKNDKAHTEVSSSAAPRTSHHILAPSVGIEEEVNSDTALECSELSCIVDVNDEGHPEFTSSAALHLAREKFKKLRRYKKSLGIGGIILLLIIIVVIVIKATERPSAETEVDTTMSPFEEGLRRQKQELLNLGCSPKQRKVRTTSVIDPTDPILDVPVIYPEFVTVGVCDDSYSYCGDNMQCVTARNSTGFEKRSVYYFENGKRVDTTVRVKSDTECVCIPT